jgi:transposase
MELSHDGDSRHELYRLQRPVLYLALELGASSWKLAFTVGLGQKPRLKTITARSTLSLVLEIKAAKRRFGLPEDAPVVCCYEAGRDGFWLHRFLLAHGVQNQVVDSSSIEVNRRQRRAKSDRLDAVKLVEMLIRWHNGEHKVWSVVHAPSVEQEDQRQLHREMIKLKAERTAQSNSIKGLLAGLVRNGHAQNHESLSDLWQPRKAPALPQAPK